MKTVPMICLGIAVAFSTTVCLVAIVGLILSAVVPWGKVDGFIAHHGVAITASFFAFAAGVFVTLLVAAYLTKKH